MTDFDRFVPATWVDDGMVFIADFIDDVAFVLRERPWSSIAVAVAVAWTSTTAVLPPTELAANHAPREYEQAPVAGLTVQERRDPDFVTQAYWSDVASYLREQLPTLPEAIDDDSDLPDPIV